MKIYQPHESSWFMPKTEKFFTRSQQCIYRIYYIYLSYIDIYIYIYDYGFYIYSIYHEFIYTCEYQYYMLSTFL